MKILNRFTTVARKEEELQYGLPSYEQWTQQADKLLEERNQREGNHMTVERRREVCSTCEHMRTSSKLLGFKLELANCGLCGCFIKSKTAIKFARCPANKW